MITTTSMFSISSLKVYSEGWVITGNTCKIPENEISLIDEAVVSKSSRFGEKYAIRIHLKVGGYSYIPLSMKSVLHSEEYVGKNVNLAEGSMIELSRNHERCFKFTLDNEL